MYSIIYFLLSVYNMVLARFRLHKNTNEFNERFGRPTKNRPRGDIIWVHCNDFSESYYVVGSILNVIPDKTVLVTYNSREANNVNLWPNVIEQFAPIDACRPFSKFLKFWEPMMVIYVGSGIRPCHSHGLGRAQIPTFIVGGKIQDKRYKRWKLIRWFARHTMKNFKFIWAVNNKQTLRFANLGAHDIVSMDVMHDSDANKIKEIIYKIRDFK